MAQVYLSIGSNMQRKRNISGGLKALKQHFGALEISTVYESEAVGFAGDNFYNLVVGFQAEQDADSLNKLFKQIEADHDRTRLDAKFAPRTLDIDLLIYGELIRPEIDLPRKEITRYAFVLKPMAEMAPDALHPEIKQSYQQLWQDFTDDKQKLWAADWQV
ncbi:2-amino-4-hydroxy-6-hydroxymethyldihydropteridine diphosphokinase [Pelagibaculum spongiae]|uniref:2-amino-4-hydroxy-6-hydroxymethyldihydropteridine diphosphokinase n=1 Tax=Pelagibaculum spongiae TaxID=2080658 RepID=A0A2V1GX88_9GAMM|nr:2-amino-4-hydroxy-6-hydroxymethyldihydropteridine diphosphokinase [Pelagibaculum spongiae]PVZ65643.1 2-amino-4-hydroxy-6-hydroxymethyldihydropteridine diphosphokinase [Pelagibaculum spongiae]